MNQKLLHVHGMVSNAIGFNDVEFVTVDLKSEGREARNVDNTEAGGRVKLE